MSNKTIKGTEIFKYGNLTVHKTDCNNYIISNSDVCIVKDEMPQLDRKSLLNLLIDKSTLTDCYVIGKAATPSTFSKAKFNNQFKLLNANYQAQLEGYAIGY